MAMCCDEISAKSEEALSEWTPENVTDGDSTSRMSKLRSCSPTGEAMGVTSSLLERAIYSQTGGGSFACVPERLETPPGLQPDPAPFHVKLDPSQCEEAEEEEEEEEDEEDEEEKRSGMERQVGGLSGFASSCQVCGWSCSSPSLLLHHTLRHAPNEARPHACLECGRRFKRRDGLNRHLNIHRDLRPFPCPSCGQAFRLKQHLTRHLEARHGSPSVTMAPPPPPPPLSGSSLFAASMPGLKCDPVVSPT